jgi:hypothetical protein
LGGQAMASFIVHGGMLLLFFLLLIKNRSNLWEKLVVG